MKWSWLGKWSLIQQIIKLRFEYLCILLFCFVSFLLLNFEFIGIQYLFLFLYFFVFAPVLISVRHIQLPTRIATLCLVLFFLCIIFNVGIFNQVNQSELWGDEIGVILFAEHSFKEIAQLVFTRHASVPPLDYWNMYYFIKLVDTMPIEIREFFYRVPYMIYHAISGLLFALCAIELMLADKDKHKNMMASKINFLFFLLAFITYYFHPILFSYSFEVRFYALAALGVTLTLFLYLKNILFELKYLPLLLIFSLNSIFQLLTTLPFMLLAVVRKDVSKKNIIITFLSHAFIGIVLFFKMNKYQSISEEAMRKTIIHTVSSLIEVNFNHWYMVAIFVGLVVFALLKKTKTLLTLIFVFFTQLLLITFICYTKGYFSFHIRHFLFSIPVGLLLVFSSVSVASKKIRYVLILLVFGGLSINWIISSYRLINEGFPLSKTPIGMKKIFADDGKENFVFLYQSQLNSQLEAHIENNRAMNENLYEFYLRSFYWYANKYDVKILDFKDNEQACDFFYSNKPVVKISFLFTNKCGVTSSSDILFNTTVVEKRI